MADIRHGSGLRSLSHPRSLDFDMTFHGIRPLFAIVLSLGLGVSCTSGDLGPTDVPAVPQFTSVKCVPTSVTFALPQCNPQRYVSVTKVVGPKDGKIKVGSHSLEI